MRNHLAGLVIVCFSLGLVSPASAKVCSYTALNDDGAMILTSVSIEAAGSGTVIYSAEKLIFAKVTYFESDSKTVVCSPSMAMLERRTFPADLLDRVLNTGLINLSAPRSAVPGDNAGQASPGGMELQFSEPVVNRSGDDLVLFELHTDINSPKGGDPFLITAVKDGISLKPFRVETFDITTADPQARPFLSAGTYSTSQPARGLPDLARSRLVRAGSTDSLPFKVLAVGVDLSNLGVETGKTVDRILLHNVPGRGAAPDFLCVAGLPVPEGENVLSEEPTLTEAPPKPILKDMLEGVLADVEEVVFAVRRPGRDHWYANFGFYSAPKSEYPPQRAPGGEVKLPRIYKDGGGLKVLNLRSREVRTLIDDPDGAIRDPCVHYDGVTILFSWRHAGSDYYHLYEIQADGTGIRQITDGPHNDIEPAYLPDGGIIFCSDRCNRFVNCWRTPVATLYRCEADGSRLRMISSNIEHDNTPWVLPDGRVLYMRWEYVDRNQNVFHHLWTTAPDGTGQMVYYGNMYPGTAMLDAKPVPDTHLVVSSFSPGHGRPEHAGYVTLVDPRQGPDHRPGARQVSRGTPAYRDPYPLSDDCFFVASDQRILVMDGRGRTEVIYELSSGKKGAWVHEPRPLMSRPREPVIPSRTDLSRDKGTFFLSDIYAGRNMAGVKRGEVKQLLVLEQLPKPVNFSGGMWPISAGGTFTLARILGTVPVSEDGSAIFEAPALRSVFFVALDAEGLAVKRMHSFATLEPGERTGCVGCHEPRTQAPLSVLPRQQSAMRIPDTITPIAGQPEVLDFPRDVQPILDEHCIRCHNPADYKAMLDLTGDRTPLFSQSYWSLTQRGLYSDARNSQKGNYAPRTIGSSSSRILKVLASGHHGIEVPKAQQDRVRLWIDSGAPFAGTYAALGSGFSPVDFPEPVFERNCAKCHGKDAGKKPVGGRETIYRFGKQGPYLPLVHSLGHLRDIRARTGYFKFGYARTPQSLCNLSRPEMSLLLRAHLVKSAGGLEFGNKVVFVSTEGQDYQEILAAIREAAIRLMSEKRFDMPDYRPNDYYLHHMVRYGILPEMPLPGPVDPYPIDRKYWASFHWHGGL